MARYKNSYGIMKFEARFKRNCIFRLLSDQANGILLMESLIIFTLMWKQSKCWSLVIWSWTANDKIKNKIILSVLKVIIIQSVMKSKEDRIKSNVNRWSVKNRSLYAFDFIVNIQYSCIVTLNRHTNINKIGYSIELARHQGRTA